MPVPFAPELLTPIDAPTLPVALPLPLPVTDEGMVPPDILKLDEPAYTPAPSVAAADEGMVPPDILKPDEPKDAPAPSEVVPCGAGVESGMGAK